MNTALKTNRNLLIFGFPLVLFGALILLIQSSLFTGDNTLSLAVTIDLLITVPLVYFFTIRKTAIPKTTVVPMMVIGLFIGSYFLPKASQSYLELFKTWMLPVVEVSVLTYIIIKVRKARKKFKSLKSQSPDFFTTLKATCQEILPKKLVLPFATEVAVIYYGFIHWKRKRLAENEFSYHKNSGTPALMGAFIFVIAIETFVLHILLIDWSPVAAWTLTILSSYTAIQILGFSKSFAQRPISITNQTINLRYGLLSEVSIVRSNIDHIELSGRELNKEADERSLSPIGEMEGHNMILHLKEEATIRGLYGIKRKVNSIAIQVDDVHGLKSSLDLLKV